MQRLCQVKYQKAIPKSKRECVKTSLFNEITFATDSCSEGDFI